MNYPVIRRCLSGSCASQNTPPICTSPVVRLSGRCRGIPAQIGLDRDMLGRGILLTGKTGSGKTYAMKKAGQQLRLTNAPYSMIVLEVKDDYQPALFRPGDLILGQGPEVRAQSVRWNLFLDLTDDGWDEADIRANCLEFARQLFADKKGQAQQFFPDAAQILLYEVLVRYILQARGSLLARHSLSNAGLRKFFTQYGPEEYRTLLEECEDPGVLKMLLGDGDNLQALGVLGEEVLMILSTLSDTFGEEGDFSIRRFVREKEGRALFLKYDPAYRETQQRLYGLLITLMCKEVLSRRNTGNTIFLCDELPALGRTDLSQTLNLGRAKGLICLAGLQSIEQVYALYGEHDGRAMLAGFCTKLLFAPNDETSIRYIRGLFGENLMEEIRLSPGGSVSERRKGHVVEDSDIAALETGGCVCALPTRPPFLFQLDP